MSVMSASWDAWRAHEAAAEADRQRAEQQKAAERKKAFTKLVAKHGHLLSESVLPSLYPDAEWQITKVEENTSATHGPVIYVREKVSEPYGTTPTFRIDASGVWLDWENTTLLYGGEDRSEVHTKITSVMDVAKVLHRQAEIMEESYARHPD